jgi:hypothetical protein
LMMAPRAVLTRKTPSFICENSLCESMPVVVASSGQLTETTSFSISLPRSHSM